MRRNAFRAGTHLVQDSGIVLVGAVIGDRAAAAEHVRIQVYRNHQPGAERARGRDGNGIDQRAVDQPAAAEPHRREDAGQRVGGARRIHDPAAGEPDFMAGAEFGRDTGIALRQVFDPRVAEVSVPVAPRDGRRRSGPSRQG